jgi:hypothetical protein
MEWSTSLVKLKKLLPILSMGFVFIISFIAFFVSSTQLHIAYGTPFLLQPIKVNMTEEKNDCCVPILLVPISANANNVYMAWTNNDTGHWKVFFAKSIDGGKTLKTMMISAPNNGHTVDQNTEISASGSNVYVTWWTSKSGVLMPVFRASNDNGDTFANAITLNSTG